MTRFPEPESRIFYGAWVDDALRNLVRRALTLTAEQGLPGNHHFYITFRTAEDGVVMPAQLKAQYPNDMTIVLQHQFDGLAIEDDAFEVVLSFGGRRSPMRIPFAAITGFADPSVNFALQFNHAATEQAALADAAKPASGGEAAKPAAPTPLPSAKPAAPKPLAAQPAAATEAQAPDEEPTEAASEPKPAPGGDGNKVVALDSFRKKS